MNFVVFILITLAATIESQKETCTTPNGERSSCVGVYDCPYFKEALLRRPIPDNVKVYMRQSGCGFNGRTPKVCCGRIPSFTETSTASVTRKPDGQVAPANCEDVELPGEGQCGVDASDRIYGGNVTNIDEFPWMVLLGYKTKTGSIKHSCGGALINKRYVLTAAHCVTGEITDVIGELNSVRLGEYDKSMDVDCVDDVCAPPHQDIPVDKAIYHPTFQSHPRNKTGDIALVRLAKRATINDFVKPICLASSQTRLNSGDSVHVAGWGATLESSSSSVKLKLKVPLYDHAKCVTKFRSISVPVSNNQLCAGGEFAKDSCRGDSGGPLMKVRSDGVWECVAVVSFGMGCGSDGWPGVYSSVPAYRSWIEQTLRENS